MKTKPPWARIALLLAAVALASCAPPTAQVVVKATDVVAKTVNDLAPVLVDQYHQAGIACVKESADLATSSLCRSKVENDWGKVRRIWADMRMAQGEVADKLEAHKPGATPDEYVKMLRVAYCELRADVPPAARAKLPDLPLLPCPEAP